MEDLQGKVAVITGGASGIGKAVARRAAADGMRIVVADIEEGPLKDAENELANRGAEAIGVVTDVSDAASVRSLRDAALDRFGAVHLVHNNAGVGLGGPIWEVTEEDWRWILGVNLWGVDPRRRHLRAAPDRTGRGSRREHGVHRRSRHRGLPRSLQRDQAGGGRHLRDPLQGPPGGRRTDRRVGAVPRVRADPHRRVRPQSPGLGSRAARSAARPSCAPRCSRWWTPASRPRRWPTACSTPCGRTPSTSSPTPSSPPRSRRASRTSSRGDRRRRPPSPDRGGQAVGGADDQEPEDGAGSGL